MIYIVPWMRKPDWDEVPAVSMTHMPWLAPCAVSAKAQACHDGQTLYVRLEAEESPIRATMTGPLCGVYQDSCLEFFFAPLQNDERYFNFEWNPLGTLHLGFGAERTKRVCQVVENPEEWFHPQPFRTEKGWGIAFSVPAWFIRMYMPEFELQGEAAGNFYKCGDQTQRRHYLAWAPLRSDMPNFHRRQDFGTLAFAARQIGGKRNELLQNVLDTIEEGQLKLGYREETIRLYYPLSSLCALTGQTFDAQQMREALQEYFAAWEEKLGPVEVTHKGERFCIAVPPRGAAYVHAHTDENGFLAGLIALVRRHGTTMEELIAHFRRFSDHVCVRRLDNGEFNTLIYFEDGEPDAYRYCIAEEPDHLSYHRFTREDYDSFGF